MRQCHHHRRKGTIITARTHLPLIVQQRPRERHSRAADGDGLHRRGVHLGTGLVGGIVPVAEDNRQLAALLLSTVVAHIERNSGRGGGGARGLPLRVVLSVYLIHDVVEDGVLVEVDGLRAAAAELLRRGALRTSGEWSTALLETGGIGVAIAVAVDVEPLSVQGVLHEV